MATSKKKPVKHPAKLIMEKVMIDLVSGFSGAKATLKTEHSVLPTYGVGLSNGRDLYINAVRTMADNQGIEIDDIPGNWHELTVAQLLKTLNPQYKAQS